VSDPNPRLRETRTHVGVGVTDWLTSQVRYELRAGVDDWNPGQKAVSVGGTLERRLFADRLAVSAALDNWMRPWGEPTGSVSAPLSATDTSTFQSATIRAAVRSSTPRTASHGLVYLADARVTTVSKAAPLL